MSWEDPIVADVRKSRDSLSAKFNYDLAAIFADIRARQSSAGSRLVNLEGHKAQQRDAAEREKAR